MTRDNNREGLLSRLLDSFDLSRRAANCLHAAKVSTIGDLVQLRRSDVLRWPNAGLKTANEIRFLLQSVGLELAKDVALTAPVESLCLSSTPKPAVLEEELYGAVRLVSTERNAEILVKLWGWSSHAPRTLDSVGKDYELTRERVRQIEAQTLRRLRKHHFEVPLLDAAVDALRRVVPDIESALGAALRECGVSRSDFNPQGLQSAAELLGAKWPFESLNFRKKRLLVLIGKGETYRKAVSLVRRKTSDQGCMNILSPASELKMEESQIPALRRVLDAASEVEWLDDAREWVYSLRANRNRLSNLCSKVLGVAPRVHLSELRHAVSKSRRLAMCPPQRILGSFVERCGLGRVEDSIVLAKPGSGTAPAEESAEGLMLRVLDEHGPVMDGEVFAEECIAAGVNATTFYIYRASSPVIGSLGANVYCKVGTCVPPGTVEDIVARRQVVKRVFDYGWTSVGRLWCGTGLSRMVITFGSIALPTFVTDLVQGEWNVVLSDGSEYGKVTCRDTFIWSFSRTFSVLGAEPTDLAIFEFDLKSRKVWVKVGGPGLFDAIQDAGSENLEDAADDA